LGSVPGWQFATFRATFLLEKLRGPVGERLKVPVRQGLHFGHLTVQGFLGHGQLDLERQ